MGFQVALKIRPAISAGGGYVAWPRGGGARLTGHKATENRPKWHHLNQPIDSQAREANLEPTSL